MNFKRNNCDFLDCNYEKYYRIQAGGSHDFNEISFYTGKPFQRGYNIFTRFGKKYAIPFLKYVGKKAYGLGKGFVSDLLQGEDLKTSIKTNLKRTANETLDDIKKKMNPQTGERRRRKKSNKKIKMKKKKVIRVKKSTKRRSKKHSQKRKNKRKRKNIFDFRYVKGSPKE